MGSLNLVGRRHRRLEAFAGRRGEAPEAEVLLHPADDVFVLLQTR